MKYKIENAADFKRSLFSHVLLEWQSLVDRLEAECERKAARAKDFKAPYEDFSERERIEQEFRIKVSNIKTAMRSIEPLIEKEIPAQTTDQIQVCSLFDVTTVSDSATKTVTFIVLPLNKLPSEVRAQLSFEGKSINFLSSNSLLIGKSVGEEWRDDGGPGFIELHMGHVVPSGNAKPFRSKISFLYR